MNSTLKNLISNFRGTSLSKKTRRLVDEITKIESRLVEIEGMVLPVDTDIDHLDREAEKIARTKIEVESLRLKVPVLEAQLQPLLIQDIREDIDKRFKEYQELALIAGKAHRGAEELEKKAKAAKLDAQEKQARAGSLMFTVSSLRQELARIENGEIVTRSTAVKSTLINTRRPAGAAR